MSDRNAFRYFNKTIRSLLNRAYHIKKLTDPDAICRYIRAELDLSDPLLLEMVVLSYIRDMIRRHSSQGSGLGDGDENQIDFFNDLDVLFPTSHKGKRVILALGDFDIEAGDAIAEQKRLNRLAIIKEEERYTRAWAEIKPLLEQHPRWRWRNAVKWIRRAS